MLLSMTGFGEARRQSDELGTSVEVRTVNNRYLKVAIKCPDGLAGLEGEIERGVREKISRGTVSVTVRVDRRRTADVAALDVELLAAYWSQLERLSSRLKIPAPSDLTSLCLIPGVVQEPDGQGLDGEAIWPGVRDALLGALENLQLFRTSEGAAMAADLRSQAALLTDRLERVIALAPQVVREYRDKMHERVRELLTENGVGIEPADLLREVSIFADRCDVNEEIARLKSHLGQFEAFLAEETSQGRKLEFLTQEIFREVNTIGSKANNVAIAHEVVDMKAAVEKIREVLQNVE